MFKGACSKNVGGRGVYTKYAGVYGSYLSM